MATCRHAPSFLCALQAQVGAGRDSGSCFLILATTNHRDFGCLLVPVLDFCVGRDQGESRERLR